MRQETHVLDKGTMLQDKGTMLQDTGTFKSEKTDRVVPWKTWEDRRKQRETGGGMGGQEIGSTHTMLKTHFLSLFTA